MTLALTDEEWAFLSAIPEQDLVEMAVDLDLLVPEHIDRRALIEQCLVLVIDRARQEGLPFSKYDRQDIEALPPEHRAAIAQLQGLSSNASVRQILKAGQQVYKRYLKNRPDNAIALLLPSLLPALARFAHELRGV